MPNARTQREPNDDLWKRVHPLLPPLPLQPKGVRPFIDDRACLDEGIVCDHPYGGTTATELQRKAGPSIK